MIVLVQMKDRFRGTGRDAGLIETDKSLFKKMAA
jgi:hypothetical protein